MNFIKQLYYKILYDIVFNFNNSATPIISEGKFVSVFKKGCIYDVESHKNKDILRLIPCQYNHGFFVERWVDNQLRGRGILDYNMLRKCIPSEKKT